MLSNQPGEQSSTGRGQLHADAPAVHGVAPPPDEPRADAAVHEPDGALVEHLKAVGQLGDGRRVRAKLRTKRSSWYWPGEIPARRAASSEKRRNFRRAKRNRARR